MNKTPAVETFLKIDSAEKAYEESKNIDKVETMADLIDTIKAEIRRENDMILERDSRMVNEKLMEKEKSKNKEKIVLLHQRKLQGIELAELRKYFVCIGFQKEIHMGKSLNDIMFEVLLINVGKKNGRTFYSSIVKEINENPNITVVFLSKTGKKIDIPEIKKLYQCEYVKKRLPKRTDDSFQYKLLLFSDHLARLSKSCWPIIQLLTKN